jgi:glycosyltransferase involved in cell wall biosynthesis
LSKVIIVSTVFPFPIDNGKKVVLSGLLDFFIQSFGKNNIKYILLGQQEDNDFGKYKLVKKEIISKPSVFIQIKNVVVDSLLLRKKSIQESVLYSKRIRNSLLRIVKEENPDIILYDTIRIGQFFENDPDLKDKEYLYLDDLFSIRYEKMLTTLNKFPDMKLDALGNYSKFIPASLRPIINLNLVQKLLLKLEMKLIEKRENEIVKEFKKNLLISNNEVACLRKRTSQKNIYELKPLVKYKQSYNRKYEGSPTFIFLGALNIPHNEASIIHFIETQMDKIKQLIPDFKLLIVGKNASQKLISLCNKYTGQIEIKGYVEDLDSLFIDAAAMIIPLLFGSGVKLKTLEALSSGLPVITTDFGVEGINVRNGFNCIVENEIDKYPEIMLELCNKDYNDKISKNARESFMELYSKEAVFSDYSNIFGIK